MTTFRMTLPPPWGRIKEGAGNLVIMSGNARHILRKQPLPLKREGNLIFTLLAKKSFWDNGLV
jgi:hypothetical protein